MRAFLCALGVSVVQSQFLATPLLAQSSGIRTYANPVDVGYRYNFEQHLLGISYRQGADPVIVNHKGEYILFMTVSDGYWHSKDLIHWRFVTPSRWPFENVVAPAALSVRDTLYLLQSAFEPRPLLFSTAPETGRLEFYNRMMPWLPKMMRSWEVTPTRRDAVSPGPWDPSIFHDPDTERWFMYWGSSNFYPLYGIELDKSKRLTYVGEPTILFGLHPERHGWERFGQDHRDTIRPFIEGAWMTKHNGKYYLQYGAPGTEYNVYANGTYVGDDPLGPFTYAPYNPVAYKPGGFMTGAGHGSTFLDNHGNYWNTGTPWLATNWTFERRISMFPAGFDDDGHMYANTRFGDYPHYVATKKWTNSDELFTGWMLLSYRKPVTASSARDSFPASTITDEDRKTYWVARTNTPDEWLQIDLRREYTLRAVQVNYIDHQSGIFATDSTVYTRFRMRASRDGRTWETIADLSAETGDRSNAYIELPNPVRARYVRYEHLYVGARNLAIGDIRIFGTGDGRPPATPPSFTAKRDTDRRNAIVTWHRVPGTLGYNVRWGIAPGKLRQTYQVYDDRPPVLEVRALTVDQEYYFAIEAFSESGVSRLSPVVHVP